MAGNMNLTLSLGFKGQGNPNAITAYADNGAYLLGGFASPLDAQTPHFGVLVSGNPAGTDGEFFCGVPSGYIPLGIVIYEAGIAMNDVAKNDSYISGQPMTIMKFGAMWFNTWGKTLPGAVDPTVGCVVLANNITGLIEFQPLGASAPTGWTAIGARVVSLKDAKDGCMLFLDI
jgi:hypothetical protein